MRILHLTTFLQGGAGRIIADLAVAQQQAGQQVIVVADAGGEPGYQSYPEYIARLADASVEYHTVTSTFTRDLGLTLQAVRQVRRLIGTRRVALAHTHAAIPTMVARLALSGRSPAALVQTMHGWGVRKTAEQIESDITLLGLADAVVTPSDAARCTLRAHGLRDAALQVIPYGLPREVGERLPDAADAALLERLRLSGTAVALCIGTIGERKNQALLVRALVALEGVAAVFIGDGDDARLRRLAEETRVSTRVHVLGHRAEASRYLPFADVLVLPSMNEGLPIAVLEAFRAGVPVVGSRIPEIAEAVEDGRTGMLFDPGSAPALVSALQHTLDPQVRTPMGRNARAAFQARYDGGRMFAAYDRVYRQVISEPGRSRADV